ncbi:unnamed protein product [Spodoptera exigua]|nr:unnamed protein product [Spodoptera exigua]
MGGADCLPSAILQCTRAWGLKGYNKTLSNSIEVNWTNATQLIDTGYVNLERKMAVFAFGFRGSETTQDTDKFIEAALSNTDWSVVLVNWKDEAAPGGTPDYYGAARNTQIVGAQLGQAITSMVESGLDLNNIILIGMSLGAQICGKAGSTVKEILGQQLPLIMGLDAAKPLFEPIEVFRCIKSSDAACVFLLHTDTNRFGVSGSYGTHNFFANRVFYALHSYQPGCNPIPTSSDAMSMFQTYDLTTELFCSHLRALKYLIEAIKTNCTMIGRKVSSGTLPSLSGTTTSIIACLGFNISQRSLNNSIEVSWTNGTQLIDDGYINVESKTVFYAFGFLGAEDVQDTDKFIEATLSNTNWSIVLVNWEEEASPGGLPDYFGAARNSQTIGPELGQAISTMLENGLLLNNTILVGFSLGAQMCGRAGETIKNITGQPLPLIVALDAAKPLFEPFEIFRCIKSTDATRVVLVHTDKSTFVFCSHLRAVQFWIENIINNCTIIGNLASSAEAWVLSNGTPNNLTCLGYNVSQSANGNYYFRTNAESPYGLGINGTRP